MSLKTNLEETINTGLEQMNRLDVSSDEFKKGAGSLGTLMEHLENMEKTENEYSVKMEEIRSNDENKREDLELRKKQAKVDGRHKWGDKVLKVLDIAVPATITVVGTLLTFAFETDNTVTTQIGRDYLNRIVPKR